MSLSTPFTNLLATALALALATAAVQAKDAGLRGVVKDPLGRPLPGVTVRLINDSGAVLGNITTDPSGSFHFPTPTGPGECHLTLVRPGQKPVDEPLSFPLDPKALDFVLGDEEEMVVTVKERRSSGPGVSPAGSNDYSLSSTDLSDKPQGVNARLADVLTLMPGVSQDQNQQTHVRQTYTLQYEVNGIMLPLDMYGQPGFVSLINPLFIKRVDLLTGVLPAEYGFANSGGVLSIQTKDGSDPGGNANLYFGQRGTLQPSLQYGGTSGKFSYYLNGIYDQGNTAFSSATPGPDAIHNYTHQFQGFGLLSYKLDDALKVSLLSTVTSSYNQLPNEGDLTPSFNLSGVGSYPSSNINNDLNFHDFLNVLAVNGSPSHDLQWQLAFTTHALRQDFLPDPVGQLIYAGVASTTSTGNYDETLQGGMTYHFTDNTFKAGFTAGRYNISSDDSALVFPVDVNGNQSSTNPVTVVNNFRTADTIQGYYVNDLWHFAPKWDLNLGVRLDDISGFTNACQVDPTLNFIFSPTSDTKFHAGYARYMDTPALQAFSPFSQPSFNGTSNAQSPGLVNPFVQDDNTWDFGVSQNINSHFNFALDGYYTINRHFADLGQFGGVPIEVGFNYDHGHTSGAEAAFKYINDSSTGRFTANLNLTFGNSYQYGVANGQYNFGSDELAHINTLGILLDHQPKIGVTSGISYEWKPWTFSVQFLYSSGLRGGFVDTLQLPSVLQADLGIQRTFGKVTDRLTILNVFDRTNLIRPAGSIGAFQTAYGPRFTVFDSISVPFQF
jgi:outer membrane receptor protein involved in Fe transport